MLWDVRVLAAGWWLVVDFSLKRAPVWDFYIFQFLKIQNVLCKFKPLFRSIGAAKEFLENRVSGAGAGADNPLRPKMIRRSPVLASSVRNTLRGENVRNKMLWDARVLAAGWWQVVDFSKNKKGHRSEILIIWFFEIKNVLCKFKPLFWVDLRAERI